MSFWSLLFGGKDSRNAATPARDVAALTASLSMSAIHAVKTGQQTRSRMGGRPFASSDFSWPARDGTPLGFLVQIDLRELQQCLAVEWLPTSGVLLFFYDLEEQPWGFDPNDRGWWQVAHVTGDPDRLHEVPFPPALPADNRLPAQFLAFRTIPSFPSPEREVVGRLTLSADESGAYAALCARPFGTSPRHQLTGYPSPIQGDDMELQAQLVSNGVNMGEAQTHPDPRTEALEAGAADWRLLFQIDSDETSGTMWGDAGMLYFWIRESDAREGRFDRTWLVLQCY